MKTRNLIVVAFTMWLSACTSVTSSSTSDAKLKRIKALPIGYDKASVLKEFGAPIKIEMVDKKLSYTYVQKEKSRVVSRVTLLFDEKNKIAAKSVH